MKKLDNPSVRWPEKYTCEKDGGEWVSLADFEEQRKDAARMCAWGRERESEVTYQRGLRAEEAIKADREKLAVAYIFAFVGLFLGFVLSYALFTLFHK